MLKIQLFLLTNCIFNIYLNINYSALKEPFKSLKNTLIALMDQ